LRHILGCDVGKVEIVVFDSRDSSYVRLANTSQALARWTEGLTAERFQYLRRWSAPNEIRTKL